MQTIDVILTVHNRQDQIGQIIAGIVKNTSTPFNLIVVYDGCTDQSEVIVESALSVYKGQIQKVIPVYTPDVNEVRANNAGMRAAVSNEWILVQDDMMIYEYGWEKVLLYPIHIWEDVFAVSAKNAHSFICSDPPQKTVDYSSTATAMREVFQIRDAVNRGPLALRANAMKRLNYLDEEYAPIYFDDMDLCVRAYRDLNMVCGVYHICFRNLTPTVGGNRNKVLSTGGTWLEAANKNRYLFWERYHYFLNGPKHDEDRECKYCS